MAVVCALEARQLAGMRLGYYQPDDLHDLPTVLERPAIRHSEESLAPGADTAAEAKDEAPTADPVEVDRCHCRLEGAARKRQGNPGGKLHACRDRGGGRQRHKRRPVDLRSE